MCALRAPFRRFSTITRNPKAKDTEYFRSLLHIWILLAIIIIRMWCVLSLLHPVVYRRRFVDRPLVTQQLSFATAVAAATAFKVAIFYITSIVGCTLHERHDGESRNSKTRKNINKQKTRKNREQFNKLIKYEFPLTWLLLFCRTICFRLYFYYFTDVISYGDASVYNKNVFMHLCMPFIAVHTECDTDSKTTMCA